VAKNPLEFQEDVLNLIGKHYPGATKGNVEQNSQCAGELAMCMGAILAFAFRLNGPVIGRTVLQTMVTKIVENATAIDQTAGDTIRNSLPNIIAPSTKQ
jgi:hypothetical protein